MNALVETEIGTIASEWKIAPLESICEPPQYGYTASAEEEGNVRFLRITDITDSGVKWPTVPYCDCPGELLDKYRLASGTLSLPESAQQPERVTSLLIRRRPFLHPISFASARSARLMLHS